MAGALYRSARPTTFDIARYQKTYGIKTIINLRGENRGSPWYDAEFAKAKQLGITHVDFRMSARRELTQEEAANLIGISRCCGSAMTRPRFSAGLARRGWHRDCCCFNYLVSRGDSARPCA